MFRDITPLPLVTDFDASAAPWTLVWWGGVASMLMTAVAGGAGQRLSPSFALLGVQ